PRSPRTPRASAGTAAGRGRRPRPRPPGSSSCHFLVVGAAGLGLRDAEREGRPALRHRPETDVAAVPGGHVLDDAQAQTGAAGVARTGRVDTVEALEDPLGVAAADPDALVDDRDLHEALDGPGADRDGRAVGRVPQRV